MTPAQLITAITTAVSACAVDSIGPGDVLHYNPEPDLDAALDERGYLLMPEGGSARVGHLGCGYREIAWILVVAYAWTPNAAARHLADSKLITDALDALPGNNAEIGGQAINPTCALTPGDGALVAFYRFNITYLHT